MVPRKSVRRHRGVYPRRLRPVASPQHFRNDQRRSLGQPWSSSEPQLGKPYTETSGVDTLRTGLLNERPDGVPRNSLQASGYVDLDLRWSHDFQLHKVHELPVMTFAVDAFNVPNHTNFTQYVGNVQSRFYGLPTSALPARRIQFILRAKF